MTARFRLPLLGVFLTVLTLHIAFFYLPTRYAQAVFWAPGLVSTFIDRFVLRDPGTHGLGYFNPVLDFTVFYAMAVCLGAVLGWLAYRTTRR